MTLEPIRPVLLRPLGEISDVKAVTNILRKAMVQGRPSFIVGRLQAGETMGIQVTHYYEADALKTNLGLHNIEVI